MTGLRIIITGATGMVGQGVLLTVLERPDVERVLSLSRRPLGISHPKLAELLVPDFLKLEDKPELHGYDACFFCAGVSSVGMNEADYTRITYDTTVHVAEVLARANPSTMTFTYVTGASTDSSEKGNTMWARVKGRTENALFKLPFKGAYAFRPGLMTPVAGQQLKPLYRVAMVLMPVMRVLMAKQMLTLKQVGDAMINAATKGYEKNVLEIADIRALAAR